MNIAIIGGSGGIGRTFVEVLAGRPEVSAIHATYNRTPPPFQHPAVTWQPLDITNESAIRNWGRELGEIDWLINAVGLLHDLEQGPEKSIRRLDPAFFMQNMNINALPTLLLAKHLHRNLKHDRTAIFATISAKVGSIEDNRLGGWYSYRASKAALNMGLKTLAIEWQRTLPNVVVAALHPGTTDTPLSKPFQKHVPKGQLFTPTRSVTDMLDVLDKLTPEDSGKFWAFDGELLPW
ncbi:SDR family oxidoreductase [Thiohalophilus sp.]|uniref:SDR family oxidoreductase n=1 Tax=Thiohalophilus sp. TaxID=3028392 RepID=UPI002ACEEC36|nr:SDR family oxidoreductase [Thiohalophilus sp.]MDZ7803649.1 SDR family oxidoreductase [Thiohalophilus sp.]